jgi:hypothetical protein
MGIIQLNVSSSREVDMRRLLIRALILGLALALAIGCAGIPEEKEPAEFRGLTWGSSTGGLTDLKMVGEEGDVRTYQRTGDRRFIAQTPLEKIDYRYFQDRFYAAELKYQTEENYYRLLKSLVQTYGDGVREHPFFKHWAWTGEDVKISLKYSDITEDGTLTYEYMPIVTELNEVDDL